MCITAFTIPNRTWVTFENPAAAQGKPAALSSTVIRRVRGMRGYHTSMLVVLNLAVECDSSQWANTYESKQIIKNIETHQNLDNNDREKKGC
jgi:hypothetical protein